MALLRGRHSSGPRRHSRKAHRTQEAQCPVREHCALRAKMRFPWALACVTRAVSGRTLCNVTKGTTTDIAPTQNPRDTHGTV